MSVIRPNLGAVRWATPPVTRFAPSPTGYLHLGHVVNAIYTWGVARALGGRVRLRIEDHDRIRSRREYEEALLDDLDWLGFAPDEGRQPPDRQSDRPEVYAAALRHLEATQHVYACSCSRKDIGSGPYDGRCRTRHLPCRPGVGIRVVMPPGTERINDLLLGLLEQDPSHQAGDLLLKDRDGHWTYQFAVTVDDLNQGITLVVRGADLVSSTGRQIVLARLLGREQPPRFLHHPLIVSGNGEKLSKAAGDTGIRELRALGMSPPEVIGRAASAIGLAPAGARIAADAVADLFV